MAKTLKQILEVYAPKSKDEKKFMDKHITAKSKLDDRGTQDDKLFKATNIKTVSRETEHGYNPGNDEKVYEEATKGLHPMALHVMPVKKDGKTKYHVMKVGRDLEQHISKGEHLSDSELDDATEAGAKIKNVTVIGRNKITEEELDEKTLTPAEMKKREEVAKAIKRENPNMPMSKKMAIATATAKKVAEETEELTEDEELTHLLNIIYENLSDENKEIFEEILEEDPDQMIEFLEQLELESDNG
jgi:hypothetical protein